MGIYEDLGVRRIINCVSTTSPLGSSVTHPRVMEVMKEASIQHVCIEDLQDKVGGIIAELTGAKAAIVTSGCDAALTMATAACMMKGTPLEKYGPSLDRPANESGELLDWIQRLPDNTEGLRNEVILQQCHFNNYCQAYRVPGAKLLMAGTETGCSPDTIERMVGDRTAAIAFVGMYAHQGASLDDVMAIAKRRETPVVMDAAYTLPPRANLRRWASMGVDLVCYAGGKAIRGPTDTGILCGRRDLVKLAAVQMSPRHGIGRGFKVDKTQITGLLEALRIFVSQDDQTEFAAREQKAKYIEDQLRNTLGVRKVEIVVPEEGLIRGWPVVTVLLDEQRLGITAKEVVDTLYRGEPGIWTYYDHTLCRGGITMNTQNLRDGDESTVVSRIRQALIP